MRVSQIHCSVLLAVFIMITVITIQPAEAGQLRYLCGSGGYSSSCNAGWQNGYKCQDDTLASSLAGCSGHGGAISRLEALCGDGVGDIGEQCDQGTQNSDNLPNACRTDCRTAYCGDGVLDNGEECDDGWYSGAESPNGCRNDCTIPVCGDGIHDDGSFSQYANHIPNMSTVFNEECDDGNNNNLDGCKSDCTTCLQLNSNINITSDTALCGKVFNVDDYGPEGVIIIQHPGVTLDCNGATLQGAGGNAGIYVMQASNVTVKNCTVTGYDVGIKIVDSQNVKIGGMGNNMSGNTKQIELENSQLAQPQAQSSTAVGGMSSQAPKKIGGQPSQTGDKFQTRMKTPGLVKPGVKIPGMAKPGVKIPGMAKPGTKTPGLVKPGVSGRSVLPSRQPKPGQPQTLGVQSTGSTAGSVKKTTTGGTEEEEEPAVPAKQTAPAGTAIIKMNNPVIK